MKIMTPVLLVSVCALCACSTYSFRSRSGDLAAINDFNSQYIRAVNDGNIEALAMLTQDDMVTIQPNWKPIEGKSANDLANRQSLQLFKIRQEWTPIETVIEGDLAYQRGMYTESSTPRGGGTTRVTRGNFLHIYRRQKDGSWRMTRDMTSTDQPVEMPKLRGGRS